MLVTISGKSASGKSEIAEALSECGYKRVITSTTRAKREGEVDGVDYYFLSNEDFLRRIENNQFLEYEVYSGGRLYGTTLSEISKAINDRDDDYVIVLTPGGVRALQKEFGEDNFVSLYIEASDAIRVKRYIDRVGEDKITSAELSECFERVQRDLGMFQGFEREVDYTFTNNKNVEDIKKSPLLAQILAKLYIEKDSRDDRENSHIIDDYC